MDNLLAVLQWLFPAGLSIWQILLIRSYRRLNKAKAVSDTRDVWQQIAESNNEALINQNEQIGKLLSRLSKLESILYKLVVCKHYDTCPVRHFVQDYKTKYHYQRNRQPTMAEKGVRFPRDNPDRDSGTEGEGGQPP